MGLSADFAAAIGGERMSGGWVLLLGILAGVVSGELGAAPLSMAALQAKLAAVPVQRCQFAQRRMLPGLETPLLSSGQMIFDRQLGLWWRQQQPFWRQQRRFAPFARRTRSLRPVFSRSRRSLRIQRPPLRSPKRTLPPRTQFPSLARLPPRQLRRHTARAGRFRAAKRPSARHPTETPSE